MTQRVKEFIEDYIDEIDQGRWEEVFDEWYQETDSLSWEDADEIKELFQVLRVLNVTEKTTEADRKSVIKKYAESIVNYRQQHKYYNKIDRWYIKWDDILVDLNSTLGFKYEEVCDILNDLDMSGVTPDKSNKRFVIEGL